MMEVPTLATARPYQEVSHLGKTLEEGYMRTSEELLVFEGCSGCNVFGCVMALPPHSGDKSFLFMAWQTSARHRAEVLLGH